MNATPTPPTRPLLHHRLHIHDRRPPQDIQAILERQIEVVLRPTAQPAERHAHWRIGRLHFAFTLRFDAALPQTAAYTLHFDVSAEGPTTDAAAQRREAEGWLNLWTLRLQPAVARDAGTGSASRHAELCAAWREAEAALQDADATQQAILQALRDGASFGTAHKEGGMRVAFENGSYVASEYGERSSVRTFPSEAQFLAWLRPFFEHRIRLLAGPQGLSEADAWRLIWRRLDPPGPGAGERDARAQDRRGVRFGKLDVLAFLLLAGAAGWLAWQRWQPTVAAARPAATVLTPLPAPPPGRDWQRLADAQQRAIEAAKAAAQAASPAK